MKYNSIIDRAYRKLRFDYNRALVEKEAEMAALSAKRDAATASLARQVDVLRNLVFAMQRTVRECISSHPKEGDFVTCDVCGAKSEFRFVGRIMGKYDIRYYQCPECGLMQTEKPYWLQEAYDSPLSSSDTGLVWRNERMRDVVKAVVGVFFEGKAAICEYACGYGLLTRMLRDAGLECRAYDKYSRPIFARGFEDDGARRYDLVTVFEALEHFETPIDELRRIFDRAGSVIFSEELLSDPVLSPGEWWYYCAEHGQHIHFYSLKTLEFIATIFGKRLYFHDKIGLLTDKEIDPGRFADCIDRCQQHAEALSLPPLTVSDMNFIIDRGCDGDRNGA